MKIIDLPPGDEALIAQAAALLVEGFRATNPEAWPTLEDGLEEVRENLDPERICRIAVDESEGDLRLGTPERGSNRAASIVQDGDGSGVDRRCGDEVATKDPRVAVGPSLSSLAGDDRGRAHEQQR
jgi:hypothetical protein